MRPTARESIKSALHGHIIINSFKAARFSSTRKKCRAVTLYMCKLCAICGRRVYDVRIRRVLRDYLNRLAENLYVQRSVAAFFFFD